MEPHINAGQWNPDDQTNQATVEHKEKYFVARLQGGSIARFLVSTEGYLALDLESVDPDGVFSKNEGFVLLVFTNEDIASACLADYDAQADRISLEEIEFDQLLAFSSRFKKASNRCVLDGFGVVRDAQMSKVDFHYHR